MAANEEMQVDILAPAKVITRSKARKLQVPSYDGELTILPGHTTYVTELGAGELQLDEGEAYFVAGGYIEVSNDKAKVLVDVCERKSDIDKERAIAAQKRALDRLGNTAEIDLMRAQAALARAEARLALLAY
jgi:F-type H+-transporting ATPase subunit epsilon